MPNFQRIRSLLFYLSLFLFITGLPFIIAFSLGYKFNARTFKFSKTGLIYVKTQPEGARIYLNGKLMPENTPASIYELVSGVYKIVLELPGHYPWKGEVDVEAGRALRLDKIILFPLRPDLQQLNREKFSTFRIDAEKRMIYYLDQEGKVVYRSDLDGINFVDCASLPDKFAQITGWGISADKKKMFIFSLHQIGVVFFDAEADHDYSDAAILLDYPKEKIIDVFWHSDNYHLIVLTNKHVGVIESRSRAVPVNLVSLNNEEAYAFYDAKEDALYFSDGQKGPGGVFYNNLYKLRLNTDLYLLGIIRKKANE